VGISPSVDQETDVSGDNEREDVYRVADELDWDIDDNPNSRGYFKMKCPCGDHMRWLHKTPSNPNYYAQVIAYMRRACDSSAPPTPRAARAAKAAAKKKKPANKRPPRRK